MQMILRSIDDRRTWASEHALQFFFRKAATKSAILGRSNRPKKVCNILKGLKYVVTLLYRIYSTNTRMARLFPEVSFVSIEIWRYLWLKEKKAFELIKIKAVIWWVWNIYAAICIFSHVTTAPDLISVPFFFLILFFAGVLAELNSTQITQGRQEEKKGPLAVRWRRVVISCRSDI